MWPRLPGALTAHFWTIAPALRHIIRPIAAPPWRDWSTELIEDGRLVRVTGRLHDRPASDTLVIVLHGLGGNTDSHYCVRAACAADARGWSCLRLALRGADGGADDIYHAGLTADLHAVLRSELAVAHRRVFVVGYSLGGHVALRAACEAEPARVAAVTAICAPLDLTLSADAFDRRTPAVYRLHVLHGLKRAYAALAMRAPVPTPVERVSRVGGIREWDALTVVPRFGFADVEDYYRRASVAPLLPELRVPTLLVYSRHDPLVPADTLRAALAHLPRGAEVAWLERAGHVGFSSRVSISGRFGRSLDAHVADWLDRLPA